MINTFYNDSWSELYHFGIKNMKWGVRRYQNADGSLTPEGRVRYGIGGSSKLTQEGTKYIEKFYGGERGKAASNLAQKIDGYEPAKGGILKKNKNGTDLNIYIPNKNSDELINQVAKTAKTVESNLEDYKQKAHKRLKEFVPYSKDFKIEGVHIYDGDDITVWMINTKDPSEAYDIDFDKNGKVIW